MTPLVEPVMLTPDRRRMLAAALLRGDLRHYDSVTACAQVIDTVIDAVLRTTMLVHVDMPIDEVADRLMRQFDYRLDQRRVAAAPDVPDGQRWGRALPHIDTTDQGCS